MDQPNCFETYRGPESGGAVAVGDELQRLTAKDVMQYGVVSVDRRDPVHKAVSLLIEKGISGAPVTYQGRLCGILSEKDLLRLVCRKEYLPGSVGDYMTEEVVSFDVDDPLPAICKQLVEKPFRRVPVLLRGQTLAGIITRADLIRVYKNRFRSLQATLCPRSDDDLLALDVMSHGLLTLPPEAPVYDAMEMITEQHVTGLPVVDETMHLLGIITEKDVLTCCLRPVSDESTVAAFMTTDVVAFDRRTSVDAICDCLIQRDFHRVPIVHEGRLVGIISRSDILRSRAGVFRR